jgi:twitching motility two-component system response regulator PilG
LIAGKLEAAGYQVFCAESGRQASVVARNVKPALVLLDIAMPKMDGYQVCKILRSNSATKDIPVIMISGKEGFYDEVKGAESGASGFITKPFGPETLMKAVEGYLAPTSLTRE